MSLYFGDITRIQTTMLLLVFMILLGVIVRKRTEIRHWGWLTLGLFSLGLYTCIIGATRDNLHLTVQHAIDGSVGPGLFTLTSIQTIVGAVLGIIMVILGVLCIFLRKQSARKLLFFTISGGMLVKILMIELSRVFLAVALINILK